MKDVKKDSSEELFSRGLRVSSKLLVFWFSLIVLLNFYQAMRCGMESIDVEGNLIIARSTRVETNMLSLMHLFHGLIVFRLCLYFVQADQHFVLVCWFPLYFFNTLIKFSYHGIYTTNQLFQIEYVINTCFLLLAMITYCILRKLHLQNTRITANKEIEISRDSGNGISTNSGNGSLAQLKFWSLHRFFIIVLGVTSLLQVLYPQLEVIFAETYDVDPVIGINDAVHNTIYAWLGIFVLRCTVYNVEWVRHTYRVYAWLGVIMLFIRLSAGNLLGILLTCISITVAGLLYRSTKGVQSLINEC